MRVKFTYCTYLFALSSLLNLYSETVKVKESPFTFTLRAKATTSELTRIKTPGHYIPIKSIVADGAKVKKGQIICEFDITDTTYKLESEILKKKIIEADLKTDLLALDKTETKDQLALLKDQLKVKEASLKRYEALPLKEDITLAEGQLKIAKLNLDSVQKDFDKTQELFKKKLSSKTELYQAEQDLKAEKVNVEYAQELLDYTKLPASESTIKKIVLEIKNINLEITKLENEMAENTELITIQETKAQNRLKVNERVISELKDSINQVQIKAPKDGYVTYAKTYKPITIGEGFPQNYNLLEIPDLSSLAFTALLPERLRSFFKVGDTVTAYVNGQSYTELKGKISYIDRLAIDSESAKESTWGDKDKSSGIKVYIMKITLNNRCNFVRPGMHAKVQLTSQKTIKGPSVSTTYIKQKEERLYVSVDGIYQEVKGRFVGEQFFFNDDTLLNKELSLYGQFPDEVEANDSLNLKGFFKAVGEIKPSQSTQISIPAGGGWLNVKWLVAEDTQVKKANTLPPSNPTNSKIKSMKLKMSFPVPKPKAKRSKPSSNCKNATVPSKCLLRKISQKSLRLMKE